MALPLAVFIAILASVGLGTALAASAPSVEDSTVTGVTKTSAVLEASINPKGEATTYQFEYGPADCSSNPCTSAPVPAASVGSGESAVDVLTEVSGLQAGTTYHYRVVATNGLGTAEGPDGTFTTFADAPVQSCSNSAFRVGPSAGLPDCRAYEMVSPVDKNGGDIAVLCNSTCNKTAHNQAASLGDQVTYSAYKSFGDALGSYYSNQYLATRTASGWSTHGISPLHPSKTSLPEYSTKWDLDLQFKAFTPDLRYAFLMDDSDPPLTPNGVDGVGNLYKRDNLNETYEARTTAAPSSWIGPTMNIGEPILAGMTKDGQHAIWSAHAAYPGVTTNTASHVFDYTNGELRLVSVMPDGSENTQAATIESGLRSNAISEDGSRIFWTSDGTDIYVRIDNTETIPVNEPAALTGEFLAASADGTKAFFSNGTSFFEFDVDTKTHTEITSKLVGGIRGFYGSSEDGSYVYFASLEDLATGATEGERNLYVSHEGQIEFIGILAAQDFGQAPVFGGLYTEQYVTPDGRHIAFASHASLTGYDSTDAVSGESDLQVFFYDAEDQKLACVSCNPTGARPHGHKLLVPYAGDGVFRAFNAGVGPEWGAAWITVLTTEKPFGPEHEIYKPRVVSDDGSRVFFNSFDALVPEDANGAQDVYQWQEQGSGNCQRPEGCISLISSGESPRDSEFVDSSASGRDVFFLTASSLLPQDPGLIDLYNAREGGGFPQPIGVAACEGEACQSPPAPPNDPTPASANYNGPGNVPPPAKKKAKKHKKKHVKHKKKKGGKAKRHARHATHRNG